MEAIRFVLHGQPPSGKGQIQTAVCRGRIRRYPNKRFEVWRATSVSQLRVQRTGRAGAALLAMRVQYWPGDLIKRDVSGILDALFHLLEHAGIVDDDAQVKDVNWHTAPLDRTDPRVLVELEERP